MSTRAEIAAAAATVEGIHAHNYVCQDTTPGTVWPRIERTDWPNRLGDVTTWNVVLILPQDLADGERYIESDTVTALVTALRKVIEVTSTEPTRLQLDGVGTVNTLFINGRS